MSGKPEDTKPEEKKVEVSVEPTVIDAGVSTAAPLDPVTERLTALGVESDVIGKIKTELGAETVEDLAGLTEGDLKSVGMKVLRARKLLTDLGPVVEVAAPIGAVGMTSPVTFGSILPSVPDDGNWLSALRAGGILKVEQSTVISAVRAALAHRAGLFRVPDALVEMMERYTDITEEQVDPEFFKIRKMLTRRSYGDLFEAIDGLDGNFVTEGRKKELLKRIDEKLWPTILDFNTQLRAWQEAWMSGVGNPAAMMAAVLGGARGGMMPPGLMQPPDTGVLRDSAESVNDSINRVFRGTGAQIAAALAYEAVHIKKILENPRLPVLTGVANREQMLKQLDVAVPATYPRMEANLTQFVLATMQAKDQPGGEAELQYFGQLYMVGTQIPWELLGDRTLVRPGRPTGIGAIRDGHSDRDGRRAL